MDYAIQSPFDWDNLPANRYDVAAKHSARAYPQDMLRLILGTSQFEFIEHLEMELPAMDVRRMDSLTKIHLGGEPILIHREYQLHESYPISIARRIAGYRGRCYEVHELPIRSYVIYFQAPVGRKDPGGYFQNLDVPGQRFISEYEVIRLYELAGAPILETRPPGLMPFLPLMQPPTGVDSLTWLQQCVETTRQLPLDTTSIDNLLMSTGIFGSLAYDPETIYTMISEEDMRHSSIFQRLMEQPLTEARQEALQEGRKEGRKEGREEGLELGIQRGREEGIELGARENAINALMDILDVRFQERDVQILKPLFESITDLQHLRQLHHTALRAATLDDVTRMLVPERNNEP